MKRVSDKKAARVKSGGMKLGHNSTFKASDPATKRLVRKAMSRTPKGSRSKAMKLADKWFSQFIRLRDSDANGRAKCVTCSHTDLWKYLDNGHCIERGEQVTRYNEKNCNAQCGGCNWNGGQRLKHAAFIDAKYGAGTVADMEEKCRRECKRTTEDFLFLADTYRKKVEWIRQHEPGKFLGEVDPAHIIQLLPDALS